MLKCCYVTERQWRGWKWHRVLLHKGLTHLEEARVRPTRQALGWRHVQVAPSAIGLSATTSTTSWCMLNSLAPPVLRWDRPSTCMPSWLSTRCLGFIYVVSTTRPLRGLTYHLPRSSCRRSRARATWRRGSGNGWWVEEWLPVKLCLCVLLLHMQLILLKLSITFQTMCLVDVISLCYGSLSYWCIYMLGYLIYAFVYGCLLPNWAKLT
jgi:hypothetical protein